MVSIILSNWDVTLELPFTLIHPKPAEETPPPTPVQSAPSEEAAQGKICVGMGGRSTFVLIANHLYSVPHPPYIEETVDNMFMD